MTNLAHYRYLILAVISFLAPVLAGANMAARAQSGYYETSPLSAFAYIVVVINILAYLGIIICIGTYIYMRFFMGRPK